MANDSKNNMSTRLIADYYKLAGEAGIEKSQIDALVKSADFDSNRKLNTNQTNVKSNHQLTDKANQIMNMKSTTDKQRTTKANDLYQLLTPAMINDKSNIKQSDLNHGASNDVAFKDSNDYLNLNTHRLNSFNASFKKGFDKYNTNSPATHETNRDKHVENSLVAHAIKAPKHSKLKLKPSEQFNSTTTEAINAVSSSHLKTDKQHHTTSKPTAKRLANNHASHNDNFSVLSQATTRRTKDGNNVPLYTKALTVSETVKDGKPDYKFNLTAKARADLDKSQYGGRYLNNSGTTKDHSQVISRQSVDKILKANGKPVFTNTQLNNSIKAGRPLINTRDNIAFNANVSKGKDSNHYNIDETSISKPKVPFNGKNESKLETFKATKHQETKVSATHNKSLRNSKLNKAASKISSRAKQMHNRAVKTASRSNQHGFAR